MSKNNMSTTTNYNKSSCKFDTTGAISSTDNLINNPLTNINSIKHNSDMSINTSSINNISNAAILNNQILSNSSIPISPPIDDYDLDTFDDLNLYPLQDDNQDGDLLNRSYSSFPPLFISDSNTLNIITENENENRSSSPTNSLNKSNNKRATASSLHSPTAQTIASLNKRVNKSENLPSASTCTTIEINNTGVYDKDGKLLPWLRKDKKHVSLVGPPPFILPRKKSQISNNMSMYAPRSKSALLASTKPRVVPLISPPIALNNRIKRSNSNVGNSTSTTPSSTFNSPTLQSSKPDNDRLLTLEQTVNDLLMQVKYLTDTVKDLKEQTCNLKADNLDLTHQLEALKPRKNSIQSNLSKALAASIIVTRPSELQKEITPKFDIKNSFSVSKSGTFQNSDFAINATGLQTTHKSNVAKHHNLKLGRADVMECGIIGRGASGVVLRAYSFIHKCFIALKKIDAFETEKRQQIFKEITTLLRVFPAEENLPVIGFYGAFYDSQSIYLALQFCNAGSLQQLIDSCGPLPEDVIRYIAFDVLTCLAWLHSCHMIHRDVKPNNILLHGIPDSLSSSPGVLSPSLYLSDIKKTTYESLDGNWSAKLGDFGIITLVDERTEKLADTLVGTLTYMSPERLTGKAYSYGADIWGVGLSLMTAANGSFPIQSDQGQWGLINVIQNQDLKLNSSFSNEFQDFINCCMSRAAEERWSASKLLTHSFLSNLSPSTNNRPYWDLIKKMIINLDMELTCEQMNCINKYTYDGNNLKSVWDSPSKFSCKA